MKLLKSFLSMLSIICLAGLITNSNVLWAMGVLVFSGIRIGIMLDEKTKKD